MSLVIETNSGKVKGIQKENLQEFLGIRYAKSPTGKLRFQKPVLIEKWEGVYDATAYGPIAPQGWEDEPPILISESEDCLFLNVFTPQADDNKRPIIFYIHGGAFGIGSGSRPRLYGGNLAKHGDVVVITIQYRLGILGFLNMENVPPNLGLQDVICALKWVRENITAFGGDPDNITIVGQSAGAMIVSYLMITPQARGLFHKVIAQSGSIPLKISHARALANPSEKILSKLKIKSENLQKIQMVPLDKLMVTQKKVIKNILSEQQFYPVHDGDLIPKNIEEVVEAGISRGIPLIIGCTADELPLFGYYLRFSRLTSRFIAKFMLNRRFQKLGLKKSTMKQILQIYREKSEIKDVPGKEYDFLLTDIMFRVPAIEFAQRHASTHSDTYFYTFSYPAPKIGAAMHTVDIYFVFNTFDAMDIFKGSEEEKELSRIIMDYWTNFARTGNPNHPDLPNWPTYDPEKRATMILDLSPSVIEKKEDKIRDILKRYLYIS